MKPPPATPSTCALCGYDLAGLPTVICPECGCDTIAEHAKRRGRISRHWRLLPAGISLAICTSTWSRPSEYEFSAGLIFFVPSLGLFAEWLREAPRADVLERFSLLVAAPLVCTVLIWLVGPGANESTRLATYFGLHAVAACIITFCWMILDPRSMRMIVRSLGGVAMLAGGALLVHSLNGIARNRSWSRFDTENIRALYPSYPLRYDELWVYALPVFVGGTLAIVGSFLRRWRAEGTSREHA